MAITVGGSAGITYPNGTVTAAADITAKFTPAITDTANVMTIKTAQFDGTNGVYANGANFNTAIPAFSRVITFTANTSWTVPADNSGQIRIKAWGAGAGAAGTSQNGGAGGFAQCDIAVSQLSTLLVAVGGTSTGANVNSAGGTNGGGSGYMSGRIVAGGAGYSGVFLNNTATQGNALLVAGGGGGAAYATAIGGAGGGLTGQSGSTGTPGTGGTQSAGGSTGGAALQGGNAPTGGTSGLGGGGGGYWGGGWGGTPSAAYGGGGGGSSYTASTATNVTNTAGVGAAVANSGDVDYVAGVGIGGIGTGLTGVSGGPGYVVIYY